MYAAGEEKSQRRKRSNHEGSLAGDKAVDSFGDRLAEAVSEAYFEMNRLERTESYILIRNKPAIEQFLQYTCRKNRMRHSDKSYAS